MAAGGKAQKESSRPEAPGSIHSITKRKEKKYNKMMLKHPVYLNLIQN